MQARISQSMDQNPVADKLLDIELSFLCFLAVSRAFPEIKIDALVQIILCYCFGILALKLQCPSGFSFKAAISFTSASFSPLLFNPRLNR
jgi:hypothetical protein